MKKLFVLLIVASVCLCACLFSAASIAAQDFEFGADAVFSSHENVADAVSIVIGSKCVAGIRTKGVVMKTQRDELFEALAADVKENFPHVTEVYLTTSVNEIVYLKNAKRTLGDEAEDILSVYSEILQRAENNRYICL